MKLPSVYKQIFFLFFIIFLSPFNAFSQSEPIYDPLEPVNRKVYWLNDKADKYVFEHVADAYDYAVPDELKEGIGNTFDNIKYPGRLVSNLVVGDFSQAGNETLRFLLNSTIGILGFFDVADKLGIETKPADMGLALAHYDVPAGPYLVLPLLGPSNLRDGVGRLLDAALDPMVWFSFSDVDAGTRDRVSWSAWGLYFVHSRAEADEAIDAGKDAGLDFYLTSQGAYYQHREGLLGKEISDEELLDDDF
ncbi:MAG: VacJ family lipoprotein [Bdellovibrionota bacterium]